MSTSGPSREELAHYFKNSRQYFDQLAKHYQETDPEYYKEYIQPFYNNPFAAGASNQGCRARAVTLGAVFILVLSAGISFFFMTENTTIDEEEKVTERVKSTEADNKSDFRSLRKQADSLLTLSYDPADKEYMEFEKSVEDRLNEIKKDDKNYKEAQNLLKEIREHRLKKKKSRSLLKDYSFFITFI